MNKTITTLYIFHEASASGGATYSGLNMIRSLDRSKITPLVLLPGDGDFKQQLEDLGVKCIIAPVDCLFRTHDESKLQVRCIHACARFRIYVRSLIKACRIVHKELKDYNIDIVHSNTTAILTGYVLAKYLHCKHVWHLREFLDKDLHWKPYIGFYMLRKLINSADATISITSAVKKHWIYEKTENAFQFFNAVKSISSLKNIYEHKEKYFLFCSTALEDYKGANWAMEAFCKSGLFNDGYKLVYLGNCRHEYKQKLLMMAHDVGAEEYVDFLGYCKQTTSFFSKATAFLMCSENEAMGRTTIEAFWNGCPVLGRNTGGTPELIDNGETGFLFDSIEELSSLMQDIVKKDNTKIIEKAREFAIQNFTEEKYGKKIEIVYKTVMDNDTKEL